MSDCCNGVGENLSLCPVKSTKCNVNVYEFYHLKSGDFSTSTDFVISNNPQLAKIERIMDKGKIEAKEVITNPSTHFFEDPDGDIKVKYNFYDKSGDIIK